MFDYVPAQSHRANVARAETCPATMAPHWAASQALSLALHHRFVRAGVEQFLDAR